MAERLIAPVLKTGPIPETTRTYGDMHAHRTQLADIWRALDPRDRGLVARITAEIAQALDLAAERITEATRPQEPD